LLCELFDVTLVPHTPLTAFPIDRLVYLLKKVALRQILDGVRRVNTAGM